MRPIKANEAKRFPDPFGSGKRFLPTCATCGGAGHAPTAGTPRPELSLEKTKPPARELKSFVHLFTPALKLKSFAQAFSKACGVDGRSPSSAHRNGRNPQDFHKFRRGRPNRPLDGLAVGDPSGGFPILCRLMQFAKRISLFRQSERDGNPFYFLCIICVKIMQRKVLSEQGRGCRSPLISEKLKNTREENKI